jgi:probable addiction module antidote protein
MDKKKISKKPKKQLTRSLVINGVKLLSHDSSAIFKKHKQIRLVLVEALVDGDRAAFTYILSGYVRSHNILEVCKRTGLSRTVVNEAIREYGNSSLETLCKIMTSFKDAA